MGLIRKNSREAGIRFEGGKGILVSGESHYRKEGNSGEFHYKKTTNEKRESYPARFDANFHQDR